MLSTRFLQDILTDPALQALVTLHGVHVKHAIIPDYVDLAHIRLSYKLRFDRCSFEQEINMEDAEIASWRTGELRFGAVGTEDGQGQGQEQTRWIAGSSRLTLVNTETSAWQDGGQEGVADSALDDPFLGPLALDYWPERLHLSGFSYRHLGGYSYASRRTPPAPPAQRNHAPVKPDSMLTRDVAYYSRLLQRDVSRTMQPFRQLAGVLRRAGYPAQSDRILYEGLEADRARAKGWRWF